MPQQPGQRQQQRQHLQRQRAAAGRREPQLPGQAEHDQRDARRHRERARPRDRGGRCGGGRSSLAMMPAMTFAAAPVTRPRDDRRRRAARRRCRPGRGSTPLRTLRRALSRRPPRPHRQQPDLHDADLAGAAGHGDAGAVLARSRCSRRFQDALQKYFLQTLVPDNIAKPVLGALTQFVDQGQPARQRRPGGAAASPRSR